MIGLGADKNMSFCRVSPWTGSEDHGHEKFPQFAFTAQCAVFEEVQSKKNLQLCAVPIERIQFEGIFCDRKFTPPRCLANSNIG